MLKLEITKAKDSYLIGSYETFHNVVLIGKTKACNIIESDNNLSPIHFFLKLKPNGLYCQNAKDDDFYFLNSKKVYGIKKLKKSDLVSFNEFEFKVIDYTYENYNEKFEKCLQKQNELSDEVTTLLNLIEQKIIEHEDEQVL